MEEFTIEDLLELQTSTVLRLEELRTAHLKLLRLGIYMVVGIGLILLGITVWVGLK